jgi:predicted NACHT family NTPase
MLTRREVKLEEVYVVPRLIKQEIIRKRKEEYIRKRDKSRKRSRVEKRSKEYVTERTVELTVKDVLFSPRNYQVVILGEPGVGKTCLLQYIALIASISAGESVGLRRPLLPVLVPLREYPKYSKGKMLKRFIFDYIRNQICFLPDEVLEHFLENNSFFFLLDGLDEVMDESERIEVSRQVERFMAQYPQTRIVLTSRPAGYRPAALIGTIPHFTLAEFNKDDIRNFLVKWFTFLDKIEKEKFEKEKTEGKAQGLSDIILKREKILRLARNPLLLTILVLIHRVGKKLPERRAEFYDHAVKTIAGSWERWKGLKTNRRLLDQETILGVLEKIGFRLHSEVQENLVEADGLRNWLEESMIEERGCYSKKEINDFLWILNERAGLMVEKGLGLYGFVHLTFQEYFAARYLALGRGVRLIRDLLKENLYSSRWREVFLLSVAIAPPEQANLMLDSVLKIENPFENYIHSNLMFAGSMLADLPRIRSSKRKEVIKGLISLTTSRNIDILRIEALEILSEISRAFPLEDISWALKLLNDKKSDVQEQALKYFTMVGAKDPKLSANFMNYLMTKTGMSVCRR